MSAAVFARLWASHSGATSVSSRPVQRTETQPGLARAPESREPEGLISRRHPVAAAALSLGASTPTPVPANHSHAKTLEALAPSGRGAIVANHGRSTSDTQAHDPWSARRQRALRNLDSVAAITGIAPTEQQALRAIIERADPILGLPVIEDALWRCRGEELRRLLRAELPAPFRVNGYHLDPRCGAHLAVDCPTASFSAAGQTPRFTFGYEKEYAAPATVGYARVGEQTLPVVMHQGYDGRTGMSLETLTRALVILPEPARRHLSLLVIEQGAPQASPLIQGFTRPSHSAIALVASAYGMSDPATVANALLHEVGHLLAEQLLSRDEAAWKEWQAAQARDGASVSDYATKTRHEHFAETYVAWVTALGTPFEAAIRARFAHTFEILDRIIPRAVATPFDPQDPRHYSYTVRVVSAQLADTGDAFGRGEVFYTVNGGEASSYVHAAKRQRLIYEPQPANVTVIDGRDVKGQDGMALFAVTADFYDADLVGDEHLRRFRSQVRLDPRGGPQRLHLTSPSGDWIELEVAPQPSRRQRR